MFPINPPWVKVEIRSYGPGNASQQFDGLHLKVMKPGGWVSPLITLTNDFFLFLHILDKLPLVFSLPKFLPTWLSIYLDLLSLFASENYRRVNV